MELDRHRPTPLLDGCRDRERLDVGRDVVHAEERRTPIERRNRRTDGRGVGADSTVGIAEHAGERALAREADEHRRPDRADSRRVRGSARGSGRDVLPKPIPGSRQTRSSGIPAATATASRSSRNAATSSTTSSYRGSTCIVRGSPCMCIRQTYAPASAIDARELRVAAQRGDVVHERERRARAPAVPPRPSTCRSRPGGPTSPSSTGMTRRSSSSSETSSAPGRVDSPPTSTSAAPSAEQPSRRRHRDRRIDVVAAVGEAVGRDVDDAHHRRACPNTRRAAVVSSDGGG